MQREPFATAFLKPAFEVGCGGFGVECVGGEQMDTRWFGLSGNRVYAASHQRFAPILEALRYNCPIFDPFMMFCQ